MIRNNRTMPMFVAVLLICLFSVQSAFSMPVPEESGKDFLNGEWLLAVVSQDDKEQYDSFFEPGFNESGMRPIAVPLNWELAGFDPAQYARPTDTLGFYRKRFEGPELAEGERLLLHFEGVSFGAKVWLNGEYLGKHLGAYTGFEFDITGMVKQGAENLIAVKVDKVTAKGNEFDCNDAWALSGIYRDVYLYKVPGTYLETLHVETDLDEKYEDAELIVRTAVKNSTERAAAVTVTATLFSLDGGEAIFAGEKTEELVAGDEMRTTINGTIKNPEKWTAETPALYTLRVQVLIGKEVKSTTYQKVGFREVAIDEAGRLLVNGVPVKLKGVNRHEITIERGRALITEDWLKDIKLIKAGNINTVRTSHYPPDTEFLDMCDEYGLYVIDEVPFGYGDELLNFPDFEKPLKTRTYETIERDRNHPAVIIWSLGNENPWTFVHMKLIKMAHQMDDTRPVLLPRTGFETGGTGGIRLHESVDILAPHYPNPERLEAILSENEALERTRPVIMTEFVHALGRNRWTRQLWDIVWNQESSAGGCVWVWSDQGIKRPIDGKPVKKIGGGDITTWDELYLYKEYDENHIIDTHGIYGMDGIVDADRTPQPDYYEIKKIYTPVYISDNDITVKRGQENVKFDFQNRYDFTTLAGMKYGWELQRDGIVINGGDGDYPNVAPHSKGSVTIKAGIPGNANSDEYIQLRISSYDTSGHLVDVHGIKLDVEDAEKAAESETEEKIQSAYEESEKEIVVKSEYYQATIDKSTGMITGIVADGRKYDFTGPAMNTGRTLRQVEMAQPSFKENQLAAFENGLISAAKDVTVQTDATNPVVVMVTGENKIPGDDVFSDFTCKYVFHGDGRIDVSYSIDPRVEEQILLELGLKFELPREFDEMMVLGRGPDTYPRSIENTEVSMFGLMDAAPGDPSFTANKTEVRWVSMKSPDSSIKFSRMNEGMNARAVSGDDATTLYLNPWVKHPSKKNSDPPLEYMVRIQDIPDISINVMIDLLPD